MPPRIKYTKERIVDSAFELVREQGTDALTARSLAAALGCSPQPIFSHFDSIDDVYEAVKGKAAILYERYIDDGLRLPIPFKGTGLKYIQFAKDEPRLFRMLFMSEDESSEPRHFFPADPGTEKIIEAIQKNYNLKYEKARSIYNHLSVYTHGLAVMYAQRQNVFSDDDISRMMSEIFNALMEKKDE